MANIPIISIEGVNGAGKTSLISSLIPALEDLGYTPLPIRSPGGTRRGEQIRKDVKTALAGESPASPLTLAKLNTEGFCVAMSELIAPARKNGYSLIIIDRWTASAHAYQGAQGLAQRKITKINEAVTKPDMTILLDCDPILGQLRHKPDIYMSDKEMEYKTEVRRIFLERADENTIIIDATRPANEVLDTALLAICNIMRGIDR